MFCIFNSYDSHLILSAVASEKKKRDLRMSCIPRNMEKYLSFTINSFVFLDSYQFLSESLEVLANNLSKEGNDFSKFKYTKGWMNEKYPHVDKDHLNLLVRKGVYPYDYFQSIEQYKETKLPPKEMFFNSLKEKHISEKDYQHAQSVWSIFECKTLGEYTNLYMSIDVCILIDIMQNFRDITHKMFQLDPLHFYSLPGLSFASCLKMTGVKLELLTDADKHLFMERGIRGGVSMISHRKAEANNPHLYSMKNGQKVSDYNPAKPNSWCFLGDINNLYGWAMMQSLPTHNFNWLPKHKIKKLKWKKLKFDSPFGYFVEVDLQYPHHLHHLHNDYPLAPQHVQVNRDMLSPYNKRAMAKLSGDMYTSPTKLIPTLGDRVRYVLHYRNLQQYLQLGMILTKVHRVLSFNQSEWMKPYIEHNTACRKSANNMFEKNYFKLLNNSCFGKLLECKRGHRTVKFVTDEKQLIRESSKSSFHAFTIFGEGHLVACEMKKNYVILDKPLYAGMAVLDISKTLMYHIHYNVFKKKYGHRCQLILTDTDSLLYIIYTDNLYEDIHDDPELRQWFDTSNFDPDHFLFDETNKKEVGFLKDENGGKPIKCVVGLRPKLYAFKTCEREKKAAKGVSKYIIEDKLKYEMYDACLTNVENNVQGMNMIRSYKHELYSIRVNKVCLSPFCDKRFLLNDGITSYSYGHQEILMFQDRNL
jgi:hypothetical protein